jgi:alpha-D-xyloside xylohydrolase
MITTIFSSPMDEVIHVRTFHFKGTLDGAPRFNLLPDRDHLLQPKEGSSKSFYAGSLEIRTDGLGPWDVKVFFKGKPVTSLMGKHSGYIVQEKDGKKDRYMSQHLSLSVGETVYGLGERFTPFVKNGQVVDIWNEDGGTSSEQAYKNIPFYLSSQGYGVLVANPGKVSFEVASEVVTSVQFSVPGEVLDYYIIGGDTLKDVLRNYASLAGKPALPPAWSFGLWLTTSFTTTYDEKTVNSFIDGMAQRDIPLSVFHFDCFWMKEFQWMWTSSPNRRPCSVD